MRTFALVCAISIVGSSFAFQQSTSIEKTSSALARTKLATRYNNNPLSAPSSARQLSSQQRQSRPPCDSRSGVRVQRSDRMALQASVVRVSDPLALTRSSTFLVRIIFLRMMALVHFTAFLIAYRQNRALIGDRGITPARHVLDQAEEVGRRKTARRLEWRNSTISNGDVRGPKSFLSRLKRLIGNTVAGNDKLLRLREVWWDRSDGLGRPITSILWLAKDRNNLNEWLDRIALTGLSISALIFLSGAANVPLVLTLWICQRSLMAVGGTWYGYGWEPQLAELSFHTLFTVPLLSLSKLPSTPVPAISIWVLRWFLFRVMMGAGLIKLKSGDAKWRDLTAMDYFYETQPVPNPLTRYFHWMPPKWHRFEVLINHFVELVAPWLLIIPCLPVPWRRAAGLIQIAFQSILILSGNLSFLNWLTLIPAIYCLDDAFVAGLFSPSMRVAAMGAAWTSSTSRLQHAVCWTFGALIMYLSVPVIRNLLAKRQVMNGSFDRLRLVNTYGAFGVVNTDRDEFVISSSTSIEGPWQEYEFQVKPGDPKRHAKWISPYHHRLDWQMWIAATCKSLDRSPWMFKLLLKLLERDPEVQRLVADDPWKDSPEPPRYIRMDTYRYQFHKPKRGERDTPFWDRHLLYRLYPRMGVATIDTLKDEIKARGIPP